MSNSFEEKNNMENTHTFKMTLPEGTMENHTKERIRASCMDGRLRTANDAHIEHGLEEKDFDVLNFPGIAMIFAGDLPGRDLFVDAVRSEERRVGKEGRS